MRTVRTRSTTPGRRVPPGLKYSGGKVTKKSNKRPSVMATGGTPPNTKPVRMRPWIENLLDKNECNGLSWVDREQKKFQIMWRHAARQDFDKKEHADVFIKYAEFTGKKELVDDSTGYNSKLKSNFRSALHSLVDCIQLTKSGDPKMKSKGESVRVYQFVDQSHPECKRKKFQKSLSQQKGKKTGTKSKLKPEIDDIADDTAMKDEPAPTSFPDDTPTTMEYHNSDQEDPDTETILLTDEAALFIANNANNVSESQQTSLELNTQTLSMVSSILTPVSDNVTIADISNNVFTYSTTDAILQQPQLVFPTITIQETITSSHVACNNDKCSNNNNSNNTSGGSFTAASVDVCDYGIDYPELNVDKADTDTTSLPKFSALGVDDTFDTPINHANQKLSSGGSVRVRKEKETFPGQTFSLLNDVKLPAPQPPRSVGSFPPNITQCSILNQGFSMNANTGRNFMGPGPAGRVVEHNLAVTVVRQDADTISQGENYNLYDVGAMSYSTTP